MRWVQYSFLSLMLCVTASAANYATNYDGINGTVTVGNSTGINPAGPFTVEAWVKPTALGSQQDVIYKWSGGGYPDQRSYFLQGTKRGSLLNFPPRLPHLGGQSL